MPNQQSTADAITENDQADFETLFAQKAEEALGGGIPTWVVLACPLALIGIILISFSMGRYPVSPIGLIEGIQQHFSGVTLEGADLSVDKVIFNIRIPRIVLVVLVGGALASAGAAFQGMFHNPLVSPDLLGASAGASFGACIGLLMGAHTLVVQMLAFAGGLSAVGIAVFMNRMVKYDKLLGLILGGILVSSLFQAGTSIVKLCADVNDKLPTITYWLMGSFASANQTDLMIAIIPMAIGFSLLMLERMKLNVLSLGDEEAYALGVNAKRVRLAIIVAATLLTSVSVAVSGVIGWVGLIIPHLARALAGANNKHLLPVSLLLGGTYLLIVDDIARCLLTMEIPIGILTAILGIPFFAIIFKHNQKGWS